jgi:pimeloyl-ACP methyl ester carboxylesterase
VDSRQAELISGIILIDTASYPQGLPFFVEALRKPIVSTVLLSWIPARIRAAYTLHRLFYRPQRVSSERISRYARFFDLPGSHYAFAECARQIIPKDIDRFVKRLSQIDTSVLILWGRNDSVIPLVTGQRLSADIPKSILVTVDDCGHIPHEEMPEETARALIQFMSQI